MAVETQPISSLLTTLTASLTSASTPFPEDASTFCPPADGISLLDTKNDLLLSYLQHLVFLILLRLRSQKSAENTEHTEVGDNVVKKLIELRAYLERGVRPLEGKLRYQIDKVLRAADDADRAATTKNKSRRPNGRRTGDFDDAELSAAGSGEERSEDSDNAAAVQSDSEEETYRPGTASLSALAKAGAKQGAVRARTNTRAGQNGVYKPPRINATTMPEPASARPDREEVLHTRRRKNALLDEYVAEESSAPLAQPSIGSNSTILAHGRKGLSAREREGERERTEYEEGNFTRLPSKTKKEKRKIRERERREGRDIYGGEDWTGLGMGGERVRGSVGGRGEGKLERREKRRRETVDGPRGDGMGEGRTMGESFEKRRRVMAGREEKRRR